MVTLTPQADDTLLRWIVHRDETAFRALMTAWLPLVRTVCRRVLGRSDLAEDAVQETFLTLSREAGQVRGHLGSWLYRTALNHAIDLRRSEQARHRREVIVGKEDQYRECEFLPPAEHEFLLEECLGELDDGLRAMIQAYYFEGRSQYEIADREGVSQVAVKKRIDRALMTLRVKLVRRGLDLVAPPSREGRSLGVPLLIPLGWSDLIQLAGGALLLVLLLRPREAYQRLHAACTITGHLIGALLGTIPLAMESRPFAPVVQTPWWLKTLRVGSASAGAVVTLAAVMLGKR